MYSKCTATLKATKIKLGNSRPQGPVKKRIHKLNIWRLAENLINIYFLEDGTFVFVGQNS